VNARRLGWAIAVCSGAWSSKTTTVARGWVTGGKASNRGNVDDTRWHLVISAVGKESFELGSGYTWSVDPQTRGFLTVENRLDVQSHELVPSAFGEIIVLVTPVYVVSAHCHQRRVAGDIPCSSRVVQQNGQTISSLLELIAHGNDTSSIFQVGNNVLALSRSD
jgi:hypothetical protein